MNVARVHLLTVMWKIKIYKWLNKRRISSLYLQCPTTEASVILTLLQNEYVLIAS
jgi:hypothetical protein